VGRNFDVLALWRAVADEVSGGALPGAHYLAEECPEALLAQAREFFGWDGGTGR
jgi:haloacetate dehalogenase